MARSHKLFAVGALLFAVQAAVGCNAVLGIEPAELTQDTAALSCHWPAAEPTRLCPACDEGCASHCDVGACLEDQACRNSLKDYRKCVGDACTDDSGQCAGCVSGNARAAALVRCLHDDCSCGLAGAATLCESYCACMQQRCSDNEPKGSVGCVEACTNGLAGLQLPLNDPTADAVWHTKPPAWEIYCFWKHCETARMPNDKFHCDHAIGKNQATTCPEPVPIDPSADICEYPRGYGNAPCNSDADCCSTCRNVGVCAAPAP